MSFHKAVQLGPYDVPHAAIFINYGGSFSFHVVPLGSLTVQMLQSGSHSICTLPPGFTATAEVWKVTINGCSDYLFSFKLGPSPVVNAAMGSQEHIESVAMSEDPPMGFCHDPGCSPNSIECQFGERPECVDGSLECVDDQG